MAWYRTGTISITNGQQVVTGAGTYFLSVGKLKAGDIFTVTRDKFYEIESVDSDTQLTLKDAYEEATATVSSYMVIANFTSTLTAQLAAQLQSLLTKWHNREDELVNWLAATGDATITDVLGNTYSVSTPASYEDRFQVLLSQLQANHTAALYEADQVTQKAESFANQAYTYMQGAAANVAYQDLAAILETKNITGIVDICVYNTALDTGSDAWRYNRRASWYNEPLNTATRGARREHPACVVIAATANGYARIYDADDPALPMWRVIPLYGGDHPATAIYAQQGVLLIGQKFGSSASGLWALNFAADTAWHYTLAGSSNMGYTPGIVADLLPVKTSVSGIGLLSYQVNDVAITVLPNAPVDPITGLQIPTITVATDGNGTYLVSVITDDGAVYNIGTDGGFTCTSVSIGSDYSLTAVRSDGTVFIWNDIGLIDSDGYAPDETISPSATSTLGTVSIVEAA